MIGSLAWIARQARPDLCYQTSRLQSVVASSLVKHLTQCNKVLQEAQSTSGVGIYFAPAAFDFEDSILLSIHDASWANDVKIIDDQVFPKGVSTAGLHASVTHHFGMVRPARYILSDGNPG